MIKDVISGIKFIGTVLLLALIALPLLALVIKFNSMFINWLDTLF